MDISDRLFILLFFPSFFISLGIFFLGIGFLWWVALQRALRR